ncbi:TM0106 family RecB-like putative nuclease [Nocardiopsis coralliicola]
MFRNEAGWVVSPTDLVDAMECDHRSRLAAALASGEPGAPEPERVDPLIAQEGLAHERAELERLRALFGDGVVEIGDPGPGDAGLRAAAEATSAALAAGAPVVYQGVFYHRLTDRVWFHGRADFLVSAAVDPATGERRPDAAADVHVPVDTKLARRPGPAAVLQLAAYARALPAAGRPEPPEMQLLSGDGSRHLHRPQEFTAVVEAVQGRLSGRLDRGATALPDPVWGEPRPACDGCGFAAACAGGREAARHLTLVAGIRGDQVRRLADAGLDTIDALAAAGSDERPESLPRHAYERLRAQAALQVRQDATRTGADPRGRVLAEVYAPDGLALLPEPSPGDVFFDMEGYPFHGGRGLEYLFGAVAADLDEAGGAAGRGADSSDERFHAFWAHDRAGEKAAFAAFVDFAVARIAADPGAHVYHYASYEADRLKLLAAEFGTREAEVERLLREGRLVDLYTAVKKSLRVSQRSYSIKYLEPLYLDDARGGAVTTAASSIDAYAGYLRAAAGGERARAAQVLDEIADYNRDDCVSTLRLRDWLEGLRTEHGVRARPAPPGAAEAEDADAAERAARRAEIEERLAAMTGPLLDGVGADPAARDADEAARALLAALAGYYRREENPSWWDFFRRLSAPMEEVEADSECLVPVRIRAEEWEEPSGRRRKARRTLEAIADPRRPHPFATGDRVRLLYPGGPFGGASDAVDATVDHADQRGLRLVETGDPQDTWSRVPAAVLPGPPVRSSPKDEALWNLAERVAAALPELPADAAVDLLARRPPRLAGGGALPDPAGFPGPDGPDTVAAAAAAVERLDHSYLAVQGPPGAGKTYLAAQTIVRLVGQGRTVGVCSTSHKAVENVLRAALSAGRRQGVEVPCAKRPAGARDPDAEWEQPASNSALASWRSRTPGGHLVGGTAWTFANPLMAGDPVDVLVIDEAGQFALADTLAVSGAARNLVLLGDPQQLPQVVQGTHGEGADSSALEHLAGGADVIDGRLGYFLDVTRRMHPELCAPVSDLAYGGRLRAHASTAERVLEGVEPGLYGYRVRHSGRSTHSPEEVDAVVAAAAALVGRKLTEPGASVPRELAPDDVVVVAPYNLQVRALRRGLSEAGLGEVRVGTVDRFQGQEAPAVICAMTASSAADLPRGLEFVLSRNRLNVALSRAQVAAVLVYSPGLLEAAPRSIGELASLSGFAGLCSRARPWT